MGMDARDLYGLPLDRFVPERDALAKALRAEGRREEAARVAALRKPSVAAWAVNQLVRSQVRTVSELFAAGDALAAAQSGVLRGTGNGRALRDAMRQVREAVDELSRAARGLLSSSGAELTATTLERVIETVDAAALDADARVLVKVGCLDRELRHVGLGPVVDAPAAKGGRHAARDEERAREAAARAQASALAAARDVARAQERRDRAAAALREAQALLDAARSTAADAEEALRAAQRDLETG